MACRAGDIGTDLIVQIWRIAVGRQLQLSRPIVSRGRLSFAFWCRQPACSPGKNRRSLKTVNVRDLPRHYSQPKGVRCIRRLTAPIDAEKQKSDHCQSSSRRQPVLLKLLKDLFKRSTWFSSLREWCTGTCFGAAAFIVQIWHRHESR